jgi:hypothetical protein
VLIICLIEFHYGNQQQKAAEYPNPIRYTGNRNKQQPHQGRSENATIPVAFSRF